MNGIAAVANELIGFAFYRKLIDHPPLSGLLPGGAAAGVGRRDRGEILSQPRDKGFGIYRYILRCSNAIAGMRKC